MNWRHYLYFTALAGPLVGLSGCGSEDGYESGSSARYVTGPITAFGSVTVNGKQYNTDAATIYIEDEPAGITDLRLGMLVTLKETGPGTAAEVYFEDDVEGFVIGTPMVTADGGTSLNVMGQTVTVTRQTVFESQAFTIPTLDLLIDGSIVEVSGYSDGKGTITATRLEVKAARLDEYLDAGHSLEIKGFVSNHSRGTKTFAIGNLTVSYDGAALTGLIDSDWEGLYVEVRSEQADATSPLVASSVALEDGGRKGAPGGRNDSYEVTGIVTELAESAVTVNGQTFMLSIRTDYENGTVADLRLGAMIKIEASINVTGQLVAREIDFMPGEGLIFTVHGAVTSINRTHGHAGTLVVGNLSLSITNDTLMYEEGNPNSQLNLFNIQINDPVTIDYAVTDGINVATKLVRESP